MQQQSIWGVNWKIFRISVKRRCPGCGHQLRKTAVLHVGMSSGRDKLVKWQTSENQHSGNPEAGILPQSKWDRAGIWSCWQVCIAVVWWRLRLLCSTGISYGAVWGERYPCQKCHSKKLPHSLHVYPWGADCRWGKWCWWQYCSSVNSTMPEIRPASSCLMAVPFLWSQSLKEISWNISNCFPPTLGWSKPLSIQIREHLNRFSVRKKCWAPKMYNSYRIIIFHLQSAGKCHFFLYPGQGHHQ